MNQLKKEILGPFQKKILYCISGILWLSGTAWLYFRYFVQGQEEFNAQSYSAQAMCLKIHGAVAIAFLVIFGTLLYHIPPGWRQKSQRPSGMSLLTICGILILTGWGIYYIGHEEFRHFNSIIHCALGFLLPAIIFLHVWNANRIQDNKQQTIKK